ncbi:hypothetical protein EI94DRAFT_1697857 [Lactarius quietus]|nr:hypothetical protein EI94DRAFT_1697857 [Lactarius quietus]
MPFRQAASQTLTNLTILGRAIKTEYLALGTLLSTVGLSYVAASGGSKEGAGSKKTLQEVKDSVKINSSSKEEEELTESIRNFIAETEKAFACACDLETSKSSSAISLTTSTATQRGSLVAVMPPKVSTKTQRPPLEPIVIAAVTHRPLHRHSTSLVSASPPNISSPEHSRHSSDRHASSPSRRCSPSRRQSTISYFPADSPRLWTPRSPEKRSSALKRSVSLHNKKEARASTGSIPQRPTHKPAVLTLAERHADLLQFIAQKESKCLELRSQLAAHESELNDLKRKWERIVHREFGRNLSPTYSSTSPMASPLAISGGEAVLNGLTGGVRALAAAATSPTPGSPLARRMTRQTASSSVSSTVTSTSGSAASTGASTRLSQSSASSVAEEKVEEPEGASPSCAVAVAQQSSSSTPSEQPPSPSVKTLRRRSRESRAPLSVALSSLTGEETSAMSTKRTSIGGVPPTSIPGINSLSAMGLGRANIGEAAQGLMDSVGSKLAELQKGQTFSKSQKRASVLFSEVSQSIFSALTPTSPAPTSGPKAVLPTSLIDEDDAAGSTVLGHAILPDKVAVSRRPKPSKPLPRPETKDDEDDEDWNW